jgi:lysine 6-dehydrogenase
MKNISVLGAGMVGSAIAKDLSADFKVSVIDINEENLNALSRINSVKVIKADINNIETLENHCKESDLIISAVPGFMGFNTLKNIIKLKKDVVDISFFGEDPFELDALAKQNGVTAVVDCGVAPGMSNIILGYHNAEIEVASFECYVGGLPVSRNLPFQYKAPFSPIDVIEEYTRPARIVVNGKIVSKPALSELEQKDFEPIGTLEAFNTDGLRTLLKTMNIPNLKEKTLRYPGHIDYMKALRDTGFFSYDKIEVDNTLLAPIDLTVKLLFPKWKLEAREPEFTIMKIIITGTKNNKNIKYTYDLYDVFDETTLVSSMARTTGYTCTAAARLVLAGKFNRKGIAPPEYIGATSGCFNEILSQLEERGIKYKVKKNIYN